MVQSINPVTYLTISLETKPTTQDLEAVNSVFIRCNILYAGALFQYTGIDRYLWNRLLEVDRVYSTQEAVGPTKARLAGLRDRAHIMEPTCRPLNDVIKKPKPTKARRTRNGDDDPSAA